MSMLISTLNSGARRIALRYRTPTTGEVFAHASCILCLLMQRFAIPTGGGAIFISAVLYPVLVGWLLFVGQARFRGSNTLLYTILACTLLVSTVAAVLYPDYRMRFSLLSLAELLSLYLVMAVEPARNFDSSRIIRIVVFYLRMIAVFAICQFVLQFAGIRLFSFNSMLPAISPATVEWAFNVSAPLRWGSPILRSNGFFLLEPSILSQDLAIAVILDYFVLGRFKFLPVYAVAVLMSFSGTGVLSLGITLAIAGVLSRTQLPRTLLVAVLSVLAVGIMSVAFPDQFGALSGRATLRDPSAYMRYGAQFDILHSLQNETRIMIGYGPGAAEGYIYNRLPGATSSTVKLVLDYGVLGFIAYVIYLLKSIWRRDEPILSVLFISLFWLGGSWLMFSPFIYLMSLVCIWTRPCVRNGRPSGASVHIARWGSVSPALHPETVRPEHVGSSMWGADLPSGGPRPLHPPYDAALSQGLIEAGVEVRWAGRPARVGEILEIPADQLEPLYYRGVQASAKGRGWSWKLRKAASHLLGQGRLLALVRRRGFDVVHVQWPVIPMIDAWVMRRLRRRRPVILTVHDTTPFNGDPTSRLQSLGFRGCLDAADAIIVHTSCAREVLIGQGVSAERIAVIPHGPLKLELDTGPDAHPPGRDVSGAEPRAWTLVLFGRLQPYKGVDLLLEALASLPASSRRQIRIIVAGEPLMPMQPLLDRAASLGLGAELEFRLARQSEDQMAALFAETDGFVFPYRHIEASGVLFLVLRYGKWIIASDLGAFRDVVTPDRTGTLIPPGDAAALASAMIASVGRTPAPDQQAKLVGWDEIGRRTRSVYEQAMAERSKTAVRR